MKKKILAAMLACIIGLLVWGGYLLSKSIDAKTVQSSSLEVNAPVTVSDTSISDYYDYILANYGEYCDGKKLVGLEFSVYIDGNTPTWHKIDFFFLETVDAKRAIVKVIQITYSGETDTISTIYTYYGAANGIPHGWDTGSLSIENHNYSPQAIKEILYQEIDSLAENIYWADCSIGPGHQIYVFDEVRTGAALYSLYWNQSTGEWVVKEI